MNNTFQRILAILSTETHFCVSNFDSFQKLLAFSEKCSWVNLVLIPKQMAENKRKELLFVFSLQKLSKLVDPAEDYSQIMARFEASETSTKSEEIKVFTLLDQKVALSP